MQSFYYHADLNMEEAESQDIIIKPSPENRTAAAAACFDCNICLDFAADPVVTLCGHLYCWPCISRWLRLNASSAHCPVCKSPLSNSSIIPLYGCGVKSKPCRRYEIPAPDRPREQSCHFYGSYRMNHLGVLHSTAGSLLGEIALAVLPWGRQQDLRAMRRDGRLRQELILENLLHQIWIFLFCCSLLFLMLC